MWSFLETLAEAAALTLLIAAIIAWAAIGQALVQ
jgi:hypothetical protein